MATCPHCKGHLTETHRCPRRVRGVVAEVTLAAIAGGLAGLLVVTMFDSRTQLTSMDSIAIISGACIGIGVDRFLRS
jgi:hypothetical protein